MILFYKYNKYIIIKMTIIVKYISNHSKNEKIYIETDKLTNIFFVKILDKKII